MPDAINDSNKSSPGANQRARDAGLIALAPGASDSRSVPNRSRTADQLAASWLDLDASGTAPSLPAAAEPGPEDVVSTTDSPPDVPHVSATALSGAGAGQTDGTIPAGHSLSDIANPPPSIALNPILTPGTFQIMDGGAVVSPTASAAATGPETLSFGGAALVASGNVLAMTVPTLEPVTTGDDSTLLTSGQITQIFEGLTALFKTLNDALTSKVFAEVFPLLGKPLNLAAGVGQSAVNTFQIFTDAILGALGNPDKQSETIGTVQDALDAATKATFPGGTIVLGLAGTNPTVTFSDAETSNPFTIDLGSDLGMPRLGFNLLSNAGVATATLGYTISQTVTVMPDGSLTGIADTTPILTAGLTVKAPNLGGDVDLGILKYSAQDNGSNLNGAFSIDENGDVTIQGGATIDVGLQSDLGPSADFPSVSADLVTKWNFGSGASDSTVDPNNPQELGVSAPTISLDNVQYDFGSVIDNFLKPIFDEFNTVITPIKPALDILNYDLTPYFAAIMGGTQNALTAFDTAGAWNFIANQPASDGKITLLDLLNQTGSSDTSPLVRTASIINTLLSFETDLGPVTTSNQEFSLGNFSLPTTDPSDDIRNSSFNIKNITPVVQGQDDLTTFLNGLNTVLDSEGAAQASPLYNASSNPNGYAAGISQDDADLTGILNGTDQDQPDDPIQIDSPLINQPTTAAELLLGGQPVDLFTVIFSPSFSYGDPFSSPPQNNQLISFPIAQLLPDLGVTGFIDASIGVKLGLQFGLDSTGITDYFNSGFTAPADLLDGIYIANPVDGNGVSQPIVSVAADIEPGLELDAGPLSISGGADIYGTVGVGLAQDGKNYVVPLINEIGSKAIGQIFEASGAITGGIDFTLNYPGGSTSISPFRVTLVDFDTGAASSDNGPPAATVWGATTVEAPTPAGTKLGATPENPVVPVDTSLPQPGYFDTEAGWQLPGYTTSGDGEVSFYGASTITPNADVSFQNPGTFVDLTSLNIQHNATLNIDGPSMFIEGPLIDPQTPPPDSVNLGTLVVDGGTLALNGSLANAGSIMLGFDPGNVQGNGSGFGATINIGGPVRLYGGGRVTALGDVTWQPYHGLPIDGSGLYPYIDLQQITAFDIATLIATATLINTNDTIDGSMSFYVPVTNGGTIDADSAFAPIVLLSPVTNTGLLETSNGYGPSEGPFFQHPDNFGQLDIDDNTFNYGGTILASEGGTVAINGLGAVTIHGGVLKTSAYDQGLDIGQVAPVSAIKTSGSVTFDGGPTIVTSQISTSFYAGLDIEGTVDVSGTLVVTGLIDDRPVAQSPGAGTVVAATPNDVIQLNNALIEGGEYDAIASGTSGPGTLQIVQTTTVDSSLTAQDVTFGGRVQIMPGGVLTIGGEIATNSTAQARVLVNFGTVVVGLPEIHLLTGATNDIKDTAALTAEYPQFLNSSTYVQGDLKLVDGGTNLVTGFDAGSVLQNDWTIEGAGTLGAGMLQIVNEAATTAIAGLFTVPGGLIDANGTHALIVNSGTRGVINQSLMEATSGGELDLAGNVDNAGGTIAAIGGAVFIDGATIAGGLLTVSLGLLTAGGRSGLDGSASALTVDTGVVLIEGPGGTLTLDGAIVNRGTIEIDGGTAGAAAAAVTTTAALTGGGAIVLSDPAATPGAGAAQLRGGLELDNVDNTITGTGVVSGDVTNETAAVIASGAGVLGVTGSVANAGLMQSASGELYIDGFVQNLQGTVAAIGGNVVLSGGTIANAGGLILLSNGSIAILPGTIEAMNGGGKSGTVTVAGVVQGGFIVTDSTDAQSIVQAGASGGVLDGAKYAVTVAQGSHVLIGAGTTLTLDGSIVNLGTFSLIGNSGASGTADIQISGATTLSGGGLVALSDAAGAGLAATQIVSGVNGASLDNIDNTISGAGQFGNESVALINEIGGSIVSSGGTLLVDGGSAGLINHGAVTATADSEMILAGNVFDAGDSLVADGGTLDLRGTIAGGSFATPDGGQIWLDSGELDGRANTVNIPVGVTVAELAVLPTAGVDTSIIVGTIANQGELLLQSDSSKAGDQRSILLAGIVHLTGGGLVSLSDLSATGSTTADAILGSTGADTLDNVDNRIVGFGTIGGSGNTALTLTNETAGTVDAAGGQLFLRVFGAGNKSSNQGLIEAVGGTLDLSGTIANAGGTISSLNDGAGHSGTVLIDGFTILGGLLSSDLTDRASLIALTTKNGTLNGVVTAVTVASGAQVQVGHDTRLTLVGTIADQGTIEVIGMQSQVAVPGAGDADLVISGTVALNGTGAVVLSHVTGVGQEFGNEIIAGKTSADTLNNAATVSGGGTIGNLALTLNNLSQGVIRANAGTLLVDTGYRGGTGPAGSQPVTNTGLLTSETSGVLDLQSDIANTGGTIGADGGGVTFLDNNIVMGGTFDGSGGGQVLASFATIDARVNPVTLSTGAIVGVRYAFPSTSAFSNALSLEGSFVNRGTLLVEGDSAIGLGGFREMVAVGSVTLSGGGELLLRDVNGSAAASETFVLGAASGVPNTNGHNTLENVDNLILGAGQLGNVSLNIRNDSAGIISATNAGTLLVSTLSSNSIPTQGSVVNKGIMRALGGVLNLSAGIDNRGGTIEALNDGAGHSGIVILSGGAIEGGVLAADPGSFIEATNNQTTLDGTSGAVTLAAGSPLHVVPNSQLAMTGTINNLGTISIYSNTQSGVSPALNVTGTVVLTGGGNVSMAYTGSAPDYIVGKSGADLLDNVNNTIDGFGRVGVNAMSLTNEAAGTFAAQGGTLDITLTGAGDNLVNRGLLEALGGVLSLQGTIANAGGTIAARSDGAGHSGTVDLVSVTVQGGILGGDATDAASLFVATNRSTLDGTGSMVTVAQSAQVQSGTGTLTVKGTIADQGTIALLGSGFNGGSTLQVAGTVSLGGGGIVALTDTAAAGQPYQIVGGTTAADTLDNTGVTIEGVGQIGGNALTLINEAAGSIVASGGTLSLGATSATNHGQMGAMAGGVLDIKSAIANAGGTIGGGGGAVLIDNNGTVSGGTLNGQIFGYYGTIDGSASTVTITAGATVEVISTFPNPYTKPFYLKGAIFNQGRMLVSGDDSGAAVYSQLIVQGVVSLSGGGLVTMSGATAKDTGSATYIEGAAATDTLDNVDNTIAGFGRLGVGRMTLINESAGTIDAGGGTLTANTGVITIANTGLMTSGPSGILDLQSAVANAGGTIAADGGTTELDGIAVRGGTFSSSLGGTVLVDNNSTLDGAANGIVLASGAFLSVGTNRTLTLAGAVADHGTISNNGSIANSAALVVDGTLINNGSLSSGFTLTGSGNLTNKAGKIVPGAVIASAAGETISNLGTIAGLVSLAGGDCLVTGAGAVFSGGIAGGSGGNTLEIATGPYALTNFDATGTPNYSTLQIDAGVTVTPDASDILTGVTLINHGQLNLTAFTAQAAVQNDGSIVGDVTLTSGVPLTNSVGGTISGAGLAVIEALGPASVTNAGVIDPASYGVDDLAGGTVNNLAGGTIEGTVAGVSISGGAGTVTNAGLISGGGVDAVTLAAGFANRVILDPGATFNGVVDGGNTIGATPVSTLELASAAAAGALTGFGTEFANFAQLVVDPGGVWSLGTSDALAAGTALTDQGALSLSGGTASGGAVTIEGASVLTASGTVTGGGVWSGMTGLAIGGAGSGLFLVNDAGTAIAGGVDVAASAGGTGVITVTGTQSLLSNSGAFTVGDEGQAELSAGDGGIVSTSGDATIANTASSSGSAIDVSGGGSLEVGGMLDVGGAGSGVLEMSGAASATAGSFDAGVSAAAVGQIGLSGAGTGLTVTGAAKVADAGTGVLAVLSGATFSAASLTIGANKGSSGAVIVSGAGSDLAISGVLNIGSALGAGDLTVGPSAAVHASVINLEGQVVLEGGLLDPSVTVINPNKSLGGSGTVASGDIIDEGLLQAGDGTPGQLELVQGTIVGGGTLTENGSKVANKANAVGVLQINTFGTMEVDGAVLNAATTTFANDVTPTTTYTVTHSVIDVNFEDSTGVLQLDDIGGFGGTIATFQAGDQFIITGGTLSGLGVNNGSTLTMSDSGNGGTDQIMFNSPVSASYFNIVNGNTVDVVACFAAGTRIGTVAVEDLRVGDLVPLAAGGRALVVWVGSRMVDCARHPRPETVWPVRVRAGAFGVGIPCRDLLLSPDHAVYVNNVLLPVKLLVNGTTISFNKQPKVTYYHVELAEHAVIVAEGLPVESYLDCGDRADFGTEAGVIRLYPDFEARLRPDAAMIWETRGAAPLVLGGSQLQAIRAMVADNASPNGDARSRASPAGWSNGMATDHPAISVSAG